MSNIQENKIYNPNEIYIVETFYTFYSEIFEENDNFYQESYNIFNGFAFALKNDDCMINLLTGEPILTKFDKLNYGDIFTRLYLSECLGNHVSNKKKLKLSELKNLSKSILNDLEEDEKRIKNDVLILTAPIERPNVLVYNYGLVD